jgi:hypothetical protein
MTGLGFAMLRLTGFEMLDCGLAARHGKVYIVDQCVIREV